MAAILRPTRSDAPLDVSLAYEGIPVRPFRFGVNLRTAGSAAEWTAKARKVESLGYDVALTPDHLAELLAPMPALTAAALATTHLRVGTGVLNNDFRHPLIVAREAATVDVLSGGRFELGLGAGHMQSEYDQAGLPFDPGAARVERLAESVVVIKRLFEGQAVTFAGKHYRVTEHTIHPRPAQRPRPPIFIGGNAPRLLALAAREADIVGFTGIMFRRGGAAIDVSDFRAAIVDERIQLVRETAGGRFGQLELNVLVQRVIVTDDRREAAAALTGPVSQLPPDEVFASPYLLIGTVDQMVADLEARRARWGISYVMTHETFMDALAPVVARLAGR
jgi:probable F420-dependent oxidoreductase